MPEQEVIQRARKDEREGKSPSTQAGEFVREEMEHIREGEHGARSPEQAIAIGLSKARRAGVSCRRQSAAKNEQNVRPSVILQRAGPPAAGSLRRNALARRNVRSNARAAGRHRRKLCRDTRSALRGNALRCRARLRRRKQHGPEGAAAEMVEWLAAARECPAVRNLGGSFF